jgi:hypothetical protein
MIQNNKNSRLDKKCMCDRAWIRKRRKEGNEQNDSCHRTGELEATLLASITSLSCWLRFWASSNWRWRCARNLKLIFTSKEQTFRLPSSATASTYSHIRNYMTEKWLMDQRWTVNDRNSKVKSHGQWLVIDFWWPAHLTWLWLVSEVTSVWCPPSTWGKVLISHITVVTVVLSTYV